MEQTAQTADATAWGELLDISALMRQICGRTVLVKNHLHAMTAHQVRVLEILHHFPEGVSAKFLGKMLRLTSGSVSQMVDRLERLGVLQRTRGTNDKREVRIQLSAQGRTREQLLREAMTQWVRKQFQNVPDAELQGHLKFLGELQKAALRELLEPQEQIR